MTTFGVAPRAVRPKNVAVESLSGLAFLLLLFHKVRGYSCWYLLVAPPSSRIARLANRLGFLKIELENIDEVHLSEHSYAEVNYASHLLVSEAYARGIFRDLFQVPGEWSTPPIEIVIGNRLCRSKAELFALHTWANSLGRDDALLVVGSKQSLYILRGMLPAAKVKYSPLLMAQHLTQNLGRLLGRAISSLTSHPLELEGTTDVTHPESTNSAAVTSVGIYNHGPEYSGLYRYSSLFDEDWLREAFDGPVRYLINPNAPKSHVGPYVPWPLAALTARGLMRATLSWLMCLTRARKWSDVLMLWAACEAEQRLKNTALSITSEYPNLRVAVVAFDMQIPPVLLFALAKCGVRSFSFQERPAIAVDQGAFIAADVVLAASPWFSQQLKESWAYTLRDVVAVGMWRTDLVVKKSATQSAPRTKRIMVLPYTPVTDESQIAFPVSSSVASVKHFIQETLHLARDFSDCQFVLRAKSINWLDIESFSDIRVMLESLDNVEVSRDYEKLNVSYQFLAESELVLCKPTSLGEEALSLGIPTIFHDYTHNSVGYHRPIWTHIPEELWVQSSQELNETLADIIYRESDKDFSWNQRCKSVFGELNDGYVQFRSREFVRDWQIKSKGI